MSLEVFQKFFVHTRFMVGDSETLFSKYFWWGNQPFYSQFSSLYRVVIVKNSPYQLAFVTLLLFFGT